MHQQVIQINSDSQPVVLVEEPSHQNIFIKRPPSEPKEEEPEQQPWPGPSQKIITLIVHNSDKKVFLDARLLQFSQFLQAMQIQQEESEHNQVMTVFYPKQIQINQKQANLVNSYYKKHEFNSQTIIINKINIQGHKKSLDPISSAFFQEQLKPQKEETIRLLFNFCEYFKLNHLKQLISVFIAVQNFSFYNQTAMQQRIETQQAFFSRQEQINLRSSLKNYAQQLGSELLERLKEKYNQEYQGRQT